MDWSKYPNFTEKEFDCQETGTNHMQEAFMEKLQELRTAYGAPMRVTSGFRDPRHSIEASKSAPGVHTRGCAVDIACDGQQAYDIMKIALELGFTGIGVQQRGSSRFLHLDTYTGDPRPNVWSY
jgi:uncharacterized protein YcbK (DUF882 family)